MTASKYLVYLVLGSLLAVALADDAEKGDRGDFKKSLDKECATSYSTTCLKLDIVNWVEKLNDQEDLSVLPGVTLVRETGARANQDIVAEVAREFPNDPDSRVDAFLLSKLSNFLTTHSIKLNFYDPNNAFTGRGKGGGGGGGGKKGDGGLGMMLAAGAMMKGTLMAVAMGAIAALAGKALMTGLISLMLSAIIGLKSLSGGGGKQTTYEVITKPVYSHGSSHSSSHEDYGGHGHSSYGRSFDMPLPLGLQPGYKP